MQLLLLAGGERTAVVQLRVAHAVVAFRSLSGISAPGQASALLSRKVGP
jgi:hypothetical protein